MNRTLSRSVAPALLTLALAASALGAAGCGSSDATTTAAAPAAAAPAATGADNSPAAATTMPDAGGGDAACPDGKVRFGVEPYEDPAKLKPAYQTVADALGEKLGCPVDLIIVEDYSAEVLAMQNGKLELGEFGPLGYVFANQRAKAEAVASFGDASGQLTTYTAGVWVPSDSPITSLADLKGKTLALSEPGSTSGDALPRYALQTEAKLDPEKDVKLDYAGGHPESLLALTKGKVDAAEINSQQQASATDEGSFDASKFREIWTSAPIPNDPITVRGDLPDAFKAKVADALTSLPPETIAKVGAFLDVDPPGPMVRVDTSTYKPLFDLASALGLTQKDV